jgi:nitrate reductase gamma subunit
MTFSGFVEGPLWDVAAVIFLAGVAWHVIGVLRLGRKRDLSVPRAASGTGAVVSTIAHFFPSRTYLKRTKFHVIAGYLFHLGLFALLLFAAPHVAFIERRLLGFGWPAFPDWLFLLCAEVAFAGLIMLYLRRLLDPVLRLISDADDHFSAILLFVVMLTGCMALAEDSTMLRVLHMLTVEILLLYFPFSRLMHAVMFVFSRSYSGAAYGRRGSVL